MTTCKRAHAPEGRLTCQTLSPRGSPQGWRELAWSLFRPSVGGWLSSYRQNAELAKLRQELGKVSKELVEKSEAARQEEQQRKALETKAAAFEKQVLQLQVRQVAATSVPASALPPKPICVAGTDQSLPGHIGSSLPLDLGLGNNDH